MRNKTRSRPLGRADHQRRVELLKDEIDRRAKVWVDSLVAVMKPVPLVGSGEAQGKRREEKTKSQ